MKALSLKNAKGLKINYNLQRANFFLAKDGGSYLLEMSQA
jgi:hypothetical protein